MATDALATRRTRSWGTMILTLYNEWVHGDVIRWNIFRVTGPLWGFPSVTSWFPSQKPVTQSLSPVDSSHKGQWRGALMFSSICAWTSGWANNRGVGDLRRHRAHYDVTVIFVFEEAIYRLPVHRKNRYVVKLTCPACIERRTHANLLIQSWCVLTCK